MDRDRPIVGGARPPRRIDFGPMSEELVFDPRDGHPVNANLAEYHLPVNRDCPPIEVHLLEERDDMACPIQSKGIGARHLGRRYGRSERHPHRDGHPGARLPGDAGQGLQQVGRLSRPFVTLIARRFRVAARHPRALLLPRNVRKEPEADLGSRTGAQGILHVQHEYRSGFHSRRPISR